MLGWALGSELGLSDDMVMGPLDGYLIVCIINMFLGFAPCNYFGTWEGYLVGISLDRLAGLMIGTGEGSLVGLSLGPPLISPLESTNTEANIPGTLLGAPLGL